MLSVVHPATVHQAQEWRDAAGEGAAFIGGGTALQLAWGGAAPALQLIDVSALASTQGISLHVAELRIGAATRLERLRRDSHVLTHAPLLAAACNSLAALSVRHLATLGGNVGWRFGDTLAPLLALGAEAELAGGERLPLGALLREPQLPLIVALWVPCTPGPAISVYEKVGLRAAFSPTRIALALRAEVSGDSFHAVRVAVCGAGLPAQRLSEVERLLSEAPQRAAVSAASLREACAADLACDAARIRLTARLLAGHLGCGST